MSYDLRLLAASPGIKPAEALCLFQEESDEDVDWDDTNPGQPDPIKERRKHRLKAALLDEDGGLECFEFDFDELARIENVSLAEARRRFRHVELNTEDGNGTQIHLFDDEISITVPYWHDNKRASEVFARIWRFVEVIQREAHFLVYDTQLDQLIESEADRDDALRCYAGIMGSL